MSSIFIQFKEQLKLYGLAYFGRFYSFYRGTVFDNKDPEHLGRLRVKCPQIYSNSSPDYWAYPRGMMSGSFFIPAIGDPIYVSFEEGDARFPCWEYGWYLTDKAPENARRESPNNYMFQTPKGNRVEFDDENEKATITNSSGFTIDLTKDGIKIHKGGDSLKKSLDDLHTEIKLITVLTPLGASGTPVNAANFDTLMQNLEKFLI